MFKDLFAKKNLEKGEGRGEGLGGSDFRVQREVWIIRIIQYSANVMNHQKILRNDLYLYCPSCTALRCI